MILTYRKAYILPQSRERRKTYSFPPVFRLRTGNPQKMEILRLRPCFPAPLRMTGLFWNTLAREACDQLNRN
jgi:hypothetical protein